jgi:hypothetical protein
MFSHEATLKNDDSASLNISKTKLPKFELKKSTQFPKKGALRNSKQNLSDSVNSDAIPKKQKTRNTKLLKSTVARSSSTIVAYKK